jgi:hypothetical protein
MSIGYFNTDLDISSEFDLNGLAAVFEAHGLFVLHVEGGSECGWRASFESVQHGEPESGIGEMVNVIECVEGNGLTDWQKCALREFNLGYASGMGPKAFEQRLNNKLLHRIADVGAAIGITIYPLETEHSPRER